MVYISVSLLTYLKYKRKFYFEIKIFVSCPKTNRSGKLKISLCISNPGLRLEIYINSETESDERVVSSISCPLMALLNSSIWGESGSIYNGLSSRADGAFARLLSRTKFTGKISEQLREVNLRISGVSVFQQYIFRFIFSGLRS